MNFFIYIPLWSYSNLVRLVRRRRSPSIYIPLWSYSNCSFWKIKIMNILYLHSTMVLFKLGLLHLFLIHTIIYIPLWSYSNYYTEVLASSVSLFTFHYGPIQINRDRKSFFRKVYLHSTMVLFKWYAECSKCVNKSIYIPLWSYSNAELGELLKNAA